MPSSVPAAVDWLVTQIRASAADNVVVADGWPTTRGDDVIAVGITPDGDEVGVTATYAQLSGLEQEDVVLPSVVSVRRAGQGAASASRAAAVALVDLVRGVVANDRRLGGAVRPGLPARVSGWRLAQTSEPRQAGEGRTCLIVVTISWQHRG
jgi:hypothetical protein